MFRQRGEHERAWDSVSIDDGLFWLEFRPGVLQIGLKRLGWDQVTLCQAEVLGLYSGVI